MTKQNTAANKKICFNCGKQINNGLFCSSFCLFNAKKRYNQDDKGGINDTIYIS